ncbi:TonB-dependent receptor domain-containing protein [uncultured Paludibaculum sp.]|uniref:TonB-dependent receptor n=1 Tax=uncultured Paludibaculum sp. TaxID=1765020 RepID=UPI002AAB33F3|nr:TonB-dependent receptor [uncultured Paludibaculum sp.]
MSLCAKLSSQVGLTLLAMALSAPVGAQTLYGSLTGNLTDASGSAVPNAKVEVLNVGTGIVKTTQTDERGLYVFNDLQVGQYKVTFLAPSFSPRVVQGVSIAQNTTVRLDFTLQVSQVQESITVSAAAVMLQTDRSDINHVIQTRQVTDLPIMNSQGRNFQALYKILPGFTPPGEVHSDSGNPQRSMATQANGMPQSNNNTKLDGATISHPWLPRIVAYVPPVEAVETVNIVTNSFDAEQGMAGGAAMNVSIKSGTNEFHGGAWEYHNNSALKARNYFYCLYSCTGDPNRAPKDLQNQFGGMIGGPIVKNKLFFFSDWERTTRRRAVTALRTVPTAAMRTGDFTGTGATIYDPSTGNANGTSRTPFAGNVIPKSQIDPAADYMQNLIPAPNQPVFPNNYQAVGRYTALRDNVDFKVNYSPTAKMQMFGRYSFSPTEFFDPPSLGEAGGDATGGGQPGRAPGLIQTAGIGGTYTIAPTIVLDANIGYTRLALSAENVDIDKNYGLDVLKIPGTNGSNRLQGGYPRFTFSTFASIGNPNVSNPFQFRDPQYVASANLGWVRGAHSFRFGFEYSKYDINHFQPQASNGPRGGFNFNGGLTSLSGGAATQSFNSWADFLLGLPQGMGKDVQYLNPATVRMPSYGLYARDMWQVNRKLTINYGVRYEYYPAPRRDHWAGERYDPNTDMVYRGGFEIGWGQFAPRAGIAYRLNEKTVLRAGAGISVDPNTFRYLRDAYPATISTQYSGVTSFQAAGTLRTGIPQVVGPDLKLDQFPLPTAVGTTTFPQKFDRGYIESWNFTIERDMGAGFNLQTAYVGSRAIRQTVNQNINAAGPGGGNTGRALYAKFQRISNITYHTPFNTTTYDSLQMQATRRVGAAQLGAAYTFSKTLAYGDDTDSGLTWHWVPMLQRNRAVAGFDRTHNFQFYGNYEIPFGRKYRFANQGVLAAVAGGWQLNWILSRMSGTPFTVGSSGTSVNAPGNTQTADQVKGDVQILGGHGVGQPYFDPLAFKAVTDVRFGTSGRNLIRGPGIFNMDASIFRNFKMTERFGLQVRMEMFGVTNTPQFNNPGATVSSMTLTSDGAVRALNGYTEITGASGERQIRFAAKFTF